MAQKRKVSEIWTIRCDNSETVRDRMSVLLLITNRKSHTGFRLVPTSMTLNDLERRNSPYFFTEFDRFWGRLFCSGFEDKRILQRGLSAIAEHLVCHVIVVYTGIESYIIAPAITGALHGQPFFYMAFACCMSVWLAAIRLVCTRAARKENPNPNSHDHCLLSKNTVLSIIIRPIMLLLLLSSSSSSLLLAS